MIRIKEEVGKYISSLPEYDCSSGLYGVYAEDVPVMVDRIVGSCKICRYRDHDNDGCELYESMVTVDDWYCADFERKA